MALVTHLPLKVPKSCDLGRALTEHLQQRFELASAMHGATYRFATADTDDVKAFSSEFNVRKRMVPRVLVRAPRARALLEPRSCAEARDAVGLQVFASRARLAEIVKLDAKSAQVAELEAALEALVTDNPRSGGRVKKVTLAIGAGGEEKAEL